MTKSKKATSTEIVFLKSNRVILRPVLKKDLPQLLKWINDIEIQQYLNAHLPVMEAEEDEWFDALHKSRSQVVFAIVADGKLIGNMGIHNIDHRNGTASTGALIGNKKYWGKGYGSEAKMILLNYAFNTLNLRKVSSSVIAFNERSYNYSKKCGYKDEGRLKAQHYAFGKYWDEILLAVFQADWQPLWVKFAKKHNLATGPQL